MLNTIVNFFDKSNKVIGEYISWFIVFMVIIQLTIVMARYIFGVGFLKLQELLISFFRFRTRTGRKQSVKKVHVLLGHTVLNKLSCLCPKSTKWVFLESEGLKSILNFQFQINLTTFIFCRYVANCKIFFRFVRAEFLR